MVRVVDGYDSVDRQFESGLWSKFRESGDANAREALIEMHLPFARIIAAKLFARRQVQQIEFDEFLQYGVVGLLEALDRFDSTRNVPFRSYAALRIEGAILNGIERHNDQQEQISLRARLNKQHRTEIAKEVASEAQGGRSPFERLAEIAVGMALEYMLEESGMYSSGQFDDGESVYANVALKELKELVRDLVEGLKDAERQVIKCHYFWGMGVEEIGNLMGVSKGRVSQIHRQALATLLVRYRKQHHLDMRL